MRPRLLIALVCALLAWTGAARAGVVDIRVDGAGWGKADKQDIEAVLHAVAELLLPGKHQLDSVAVSHGERSPVVLYERGAAGEYQVLLHARDAHWHLYVYEFAHEFCHIVSNYDRGDPRQRPNQWFEEALCETASLFALHTLAERWQASPPTPGLALASRQLRWFYDLLMAEEHRRLGETDFASWLVQHEDTLRRDPYLRQQNELVATRLLPLFVADPTRWEALRHLNLDPADRHCGLDEYLDHWFGNARAEHKDAVAAVRHAILVDTGTRLAAGEPNRHAPPRAFPNGSN